MGSPVSVNFATPETSYRFGLYVLDPVNGTLTRNQMRVRLQEQPFQLLLLLVERAGQIVSREEIRNRLWPQNTFVEFDKSLGVAVLKVREALADEASNPRFIETIPRRGYRFIAPVKVETVPNQNPAIATSAVPDLVVAQPARLLRKHWLRALIVLFLVSAVGYVLYPRRRPVFDPVSATPLLTPIHVRRSVAILGFRNLPGRKEDDWLSSAFCEMLNTELAAGGRLRMVSGEDVARAKSELPLTVEDSLGKSTLQHLRINPGADVVVIGSYTMLPTDPKRKIRLDVRLQDTVRGETIAEESVSGDESDLFNLVADLGGKLREKLGAAPVSEEGELATRAALPSNEKAAHLYAEGRSRLWAF
ncbi:MAG TPA: winged helix-turn-helix domain-containing protein, partial [Terriglobales bacterium]|nr:winged helix-turn-helix domain-containing protein [Terriglobales bacterium]